MKNIFEKIQDEIPEMDEHTKLLLARKVIEKVSYYDEPFDKMLKVMLLFYKEVNRFESGEFDSLFQERLEAHIDEMFDIDIDDILE